MNFGPYFLLPYEFTPTVLVLCVLAIAVYLRGWLRRRRAGIKTGGWRVTAFLLGVVLMYVVLQTHYDYMGQHMFFLHRLQHLILHHMAPFLIMIAMPGAVLVAGVPERLRVRFLRPLAHSPAVRIPYRAIQQPIVAGVLFVGLIYLWLWPGIHFYAMLNVPLYNVMNWSMAVDGLLFWYLMLCSTRPAAGGLHYGWRILVLGATIVPQIVIGAYLALTRVEVYHVYAVCGRLWPISPITDQHIGGLITWIPAAMMTVIGMLVVLGRWIREEGIGPDRARAAGPNVGKEDSNACV